MVVVVVVAVVAFVTEVRVPGCNAGCTAGTAPVVVVTATVVGGAGAGPNGAFGGGGAVGACPAGKSVELGTVP